jgi:hypothetical protein
MRINENRLRRIIKEEMDRDENAGMLARQLRDIINDSNNHESIYTIFEMWPDKMMSTDEKRKMAEKFNLMLQIFIGR